MRVIALGALLAAACALAPPGDDSRHGRAVFEGVTVEEVRRAAVAAVGDLGGSTGSVRVTADGRVVADHHGWTTFEVRFDELDEGIAAEVEIRPEERLSCGMARRAPAGGGRPGADPGGAVVALEGGDVERVDRSVAYGGARARDDGCSGETREWTGKGPAGILDDIRTRLD